MLKDSRKSPVAFGIMRDRPYERRHTHQGYIKVHRAANCNAGQLAFDTRFHQALLDGYEASPSCSSSTVDSRETVRAAASGHVPLPARVSFIPSQPGRYF